MKVYAPTKETRAWIKKHDGTFKVAQIKQASGRITVVSLSKKRLLALGVEGAGFPKSLEYPNTLVLGLKLPEESTFHKGVFEEVKSQTTFLTP